MKVPRAADRPDRSAAGPRPARPKAPKPSASPGALTQRPASRGLAAPVAPADQPVRRDRGECGRQRQGAAVARLERRAARSTAPASAGRASTSARSIVTRPGSGSPSVAMSASGRSPASYSARISASARQVGWRSRIARQRVARSPPARARRPASASRRPERRPRRAPSGRPGGAGRTRRGRRRRPAARPASRRRRSPGPTARRRRRDRGRSPAPSGGNRPAGT